MLEDLQQLERLQGESSPPILLDTKSPVIANWGLRSTQSFHGCPDSREEDAKRNRMAFLGRSAGELVVIIADVLIALWADGMRQDRIDRAAEVEHLESMHADFETSLVELDSVLAEHTDQLAALERFLAGDLSGEPSDSLRRWAYEGAWMIVQWSPQVSTLRDLQASGDLRVIQDTELRRGLAELDRILGLGAYEHADLTATQQRLVDPFMVARLDLPSLFFDTIPARKGVRLATVLESEEAKNLIAFKLALAPYELAQRERQQAHLGRLVGLIERRLSELDAVR